MSAALAFLFPCRADARPASCAPSPHPPRLAQTHAPASAQEYALRSAANDCVPLGCNVPLGYNLPMAGNGHLYNKTVDSLLRPTQVTHGGGILFDRSYSYDARSLITAIADGVDPSRSQGFSYNGLGQLTQATGVWGTASYSYDSLGNIRSKSFTNFPGTGSRTLNMSYDAQNRLASYTDTGPGGNKTLLHDARGNVTALGALAFIYDLSDQPTAVLGAATGVYSYDGNLKRVKGVVDGKTIYNVYNAAGQLVHVDHDTDGTSTDYMRAAGMTLARIKDTDGVNIYHGAETYLHNDHLGSVAAGTDAAGTLLWTEHHSPYGEPLSPNAANDNEATFTGHIRDKATGLNYMQARYYDPVIGRFLSIDPVTFMDTGNPAMFNRYAYVFNDPVNLIDPDGECPICPVILAAIWVADKAYGAYDGYQTAKAVKNGDISVAEAAASQASSQAAGMVGGPIARVVAKKAAKKATKSLNKLKPDPKATGDHTTFKTDADGNVTRHETWTENSQNPTGFDSKQSTDVSGKPHRNKTTGDKVPTPHTQGKEIPGGVRPATPDEIPKPRN